LLSRNDRYRAAGQSPEIFLGHAVEHSIGRKPRVLIAQNIDKCLPPLRAKLQSARSRSDAILARRMRVISGKQLRVF
jgi:hypothetical protein